MINRKYALGLVATLRERCEYPPLCGTCYKCAAADALELSGRNIEELSAPAPAQYADLVARLRERCDERPNLPRGAYAVWCEANETLPVEYQDAFKHGIRAERADIKRIIESLTKGGGK